MILQGMREKEIFTSNLPFRVVANNEVNFSYPLHWHNAVEIIYAVKNGCTVNVGNNSYNLTEKDIIIVAAGDMHNFHTSNSNGIIYFIQFDYTKLFGFNTIASHKAYQYNTEIISCYKNKKVHDNLEVEILKIIDEYNNMSFGSDLFINARFLDITTILSRNLINNQTANKFDNNTYSLSKLDKAFEYIDENYNKQISLTDVAKAVGFSEYHFSRFFKKVTEKNFHAYLNEYRIKKAEKLLFDDTTITEVAYASGFNSIVTFNRTFKQIKGCSPSEYIKRRI